MLDSLGDSSAHSYTELIKTETLDIRCDVNVLRWRTLSWILLIRIESLKRKLVRRNWLKVANEIGGVKWDGHYMVILEIEEV